MQVIEGDFVMVLKSFIPIMEVDKGYSESNSWVWMPDQILLTVIFGKFLNFKTIVNSTENVNDNNSTYCKSLFWELNEITYVYFSVQC